MPAYLADRLRFLSLAVLARAVRDHRWRRVRGFPVPPELLRFFHGKHSALEMWCDMADVTPDAIRARLESQ